VLKKELDVRVIGKYKGKDIKIITLHLAQTYGGYLCGKKETMNLEIVASKIGQKSTELFGLHVPYYNTDLNDIDFKNALPLETVYVELECFVPIKEGDGSALVLVWFQNPGDDPFIIAKEKLKGIIWEEKAKDFEL